MSSTNQREHRISSELASFIDALRANAPAPDLAMNLQMYSFLVGSWEMDVTIHKDDGSKAATRGHIHAGWVLEGLAI